MVRLRAVWVGVVVRYLALCGGALHTAAGLGHRRTEEPDIAIVGIDYFLLTKSFCKFYVNFLCPKKSKVFASFMQVLCDFYASFMQVSQKSQKNCKLNASFLQVFGDLYKTYLKFTTQKT